MKKCFFPKIMRFCTAKTVANQEKARSFFHSAHTNLSKKMFGALTPIQKSFFIDQLYKTAQRLLWIISRQYSKIKNSKKYVC